MAIRAARRGASLAVAIYLPIAVVAAALASNPLAALPSAYAVPIASIAIVSGVAGMALLGAGLAPAALGSRIDAVVVAIALAIGAPVAATASFVIWGWIMELDPRIGTDIAAPFLRAGVSAAMQIAPLVALGAAAWVTILRRISPPLPAPPAVPPTASTRP
jgi:hypothetical protein